MRIGDDLKRALTLAAIIIVLTALVMACGKPEPTAAPAPDPSSVATATATPMPTSTPTQAPFGGATTTPSSDEPTSIPLVPTVPRALTPSPRTGPSLTPKSRPLLPPATAPAPALTPTPIPILTSTTDRVLPPARAPTATPTTARTSNSSDVLHLLIGELAALRKDSPDQFLALGDNMVDDFIIAYGSESVAADAHFLKTCFADGDGHASLESGWALMAPVTAGSRTLESLKVSNDSPIRALRQFPLSFRSYPMSWTLLGHPDFSSIMNAACPLFFDVINGPFERYLLWRSWEPDKTRFAATDIAEEISRTPYGNIVDYTLALILYDEAEKIRLLEGIIDNGPMRRIARTAFKQL